MWCSITEVKCLIILIFFPLVVVVDVVKKNHAKNNIIKFDIWTVHNKTENVIYICRKFWNFCDFKMEDLISKNRHSIGIL